MKKLGYFLLILALLSATLVACGGEEATQPPAAAQTKTVILGFTSSKTGAQEVPSTGQTRGLELWRESGLPLRASSVLPTALNDTN